MYSVPAACARRTHTVSTTELGIKDALDAMQYTASGNFGALTFIQNHSSSTYYTPSLGGNYHSGSP